MLVLAVPSMDANALGWPFDPQTVPKDTAIFQIFGDWNSQQIHDGLDFQAPIGTPVKSIEAGVVIAVQPDPNGTDQGIVIIGATKGATEGWKYGHVDFPPAVLAVLVNSRDTGTVLPAGTQVGTVTDFRGVGPDHLHLERSLPNGVSVPKNPASFFASGDLPAMAPLLDPAKIFFVPDGNSKNFPFLSAGGIPQIDKKVDILVEAHNQVGILTSAGAYRVSYRVSNAGGTVIPERSLAIFNQFPEPDEFSKFNIVYAPGSELNKGLYVVTNTGNQAPSATNGLTNAIENAWFTNAKIGANDGAGPLAAGDLARSAVESKYPEGKYTVGVVVDSFGGGTLTRERVVNVRNWRPDTFETKIKDSNGVLKKILRWIWDATEGVFKKSTPLDVSMGPGTYTIEVTFSEPMVNPTLSIDTFGDVPLTSSEFTDLQKTFSGTFEIGGNSPIQDGLRTVTISAQDIGGDQILQKGPSTESINPATQLARGEDGVLAGAGGSDTSVRLTLDLTPPALGARSPAAGKLINHARPLISAAVDDLLSGVDPASLRLALDGQSVPGVQDSSTSISITFQPTSDLAEGLHEACVQAADKAGNLLSGPAACWSFRVDLTTPSAALPGLVQVSTFGRLATGELAVTAQAQDNIGVGDIRFVHLGRLPQPDGSPGSQPNAPIVRDFSAEPPQQVRVTSFPAVGEGSLLNGDLYDVVAVDLAGNASSSATFVVDYTAPSHEVFDVALSTTILDDGITGSRVWRIDAADLYYSGVASIELINLSRDFSARAVLAGGATEQYTFRDLPNGDYWVITQDLVGNRRVTGVTLDPTLAAPRVSVWDSLGAPLYDSASGIRAERPSSAGNDYTIELVDKEEGIASIEIPAVGYSRTFNPPARGAEGYTGIGDSAVRESIGPGGKLMLGLRGLLAPGPWSIRVVNGLGNATELPLKLATLRADVNLDSLASRPTFDAQGNPNFTVDLTMTASASEGVSRVGCRTFPAGFLAGCPTNPGGLSYELATSTDGVARILYTDVSDNDGSQLAHAFTYYVAGFGGALRPSASTDVIDTASIALDESGTIGSGAFTTREFDTFESSPYMLDNSSMMAGGLLLAGATDAAPSPYGSYQMPIAAYELVSGTPTAGFLVNLSTVTPTEAAHLQLYLDTDGRSFLVYEGSLWTRGFPEDSFLDRAPPRDIRVGRRYRWRLVVDDFLRGRIESWRCAEMHPTIPDYCVSGLPLYSQVTSMGLGFAGVRFTRSQGPMSAVLLNDVSSVDVPFGPTVKAVGVSAQWGSLALSRTTRRPPIGYKALPEDAAYSVWESGVTSPLRLALEPDLASLTAEQVAGLRVVAVDGRGVFSEVAMSTQSSTLYADVPGGNPATLMAVVPVYQRPQEVAQGDLRFVSGEQGVTVAPVSSDTIRAALAQLLAGGKLLVGETYFVGPEGRSFSPPATVSMRYSAAQLAALGLRPEQVAVYQFTPGSRFDRLFDQQSGGDLIAARVPQLHSYFGVFADTTPVLQADATPPQSFLTALGPSFSDQSGLHLSTSGALALSATDPQVSGFATSGVESILYALDGAAPAAYAGPFTPPVGSHSLQYAAVDRAGNQEAIHTTQVVVESGGTDGGGGGGGGGGGNDTAAPVTSLILSSQFRFFGPSGEVFLSSPAAAALSASDEASGPARTFFALEPSAELLASGLNANTTGLFSVYTDSIPLAEGARTLAFASVDHAGNYEALKTTTVYVDATAPLVTLSSAGAVMTLTADDPVVDGAASGVQEVFYLVDGDPASCQGAPDPQAQSGTCANPLYAGPFTLSPGVHTVFFGAKDHVDNDAVSSATVTIVPADLQAPTAVLTPAQDAIVAGVPLPQVGGASGVALQAVLSDAVSGIDLTSLQMRLFGTFLPAQGIVPSLVTVSAPSGGGAPRPWQSLAALPAARHSHAMVAARGYVYVLGGQLSGARTASVISARILEDGSLGAWQANTSLPKVLDRHAALVIDDRLYVVGGRGVSASSYNVYWATVQADGSLSAWTAAESLPTNDAAELVGLTAANGFIYVVGGQFNNGYSDSRTIRFAKACATGLCSGWTTSQILFGDILGLSRTAAFGTPDGLYLYSIGGEWTTGAGSYSNPVFRGYRFSIDPVSGQITSYATPLNAASLPEPLMGHVMMVQGPHLWVAGGSNETISGYSPTPGTPIARVYHGKLSTDDSAITWTTDPGWALPSAVHSAAAALWDGRLYLTGGLGTGGGAKADALGAQIDHGPVSPVTVTGFQPIGSGSYTFRTEGKDMSGNALSVTSSFQIDSAPPALRLVVDGRIVEGLAYARSRRPQATIVATDSPAGVEASGYRLVVDGVERTSSLSGPSWAPDFDLAEGSHTVVFSAADRAGNRSTGAAAFLVDSLPPALTALSAGPFNTPRPELRASMSDSGSGLEPAALRLVVAGATVAAAVTHDGGALGAPTAWTAATPLPQGVEQPGLAAVKGFLFAIGGRVQSGGTLVPGKLVYRAPIDAGGGVGAWTQLPDYPQPSTGHRVVVVDDRIYVLGGRNQSGAQNWYWARVQSDGSLTAWTGFAAPQTGYEYVGATTVGGYIYYAGGSYSCSVWPWIYAAQACPTGICGGWRQLTTLPHALTKFEMAAVEGDLHIFVPGGVNQLCPENVSNSVYHAAIDPLTGDIGAWSQTTPMPYARDSHATITSGRNFYLVGGRTGSNWAPAITTSVAHGRMNLDHQIPAWSSDPSYALPAPRQLLEGVAWDSRLYVAGGVDASGAPRPEVYMASVDGGAPSAATATYVPAAALAEGLHSLQTSGQDVVGNAGTYAVSFRVDLTTPASALAALGPSRLLSGTLFGRTTDWALEASDPGGSGIARVLAAVDGGPFIAVGTSPFILPQGPHELSFHSEDLAGNVEETRIARVVSDIVAPASAQDLALVDRATGTLRVSWTGPGDDGSAGILLSGLALIQRETGTPVFSTSAAQVFLPLAGQGPGPLSLALTGLQPGTTYSIALWTRDTAGNDSSISNVLVAQTLAISQSVDGVATLVSPLAQLYVATVTTAEQPGAYTVATTEQGLRLLTTGFYELEGGPVVFTATATLTFVFDPAGVDLQQVAIYRWNGVYWDSAPVSSQMLTLLPSGLYEIAGILATTSLYGVFERLDIRAPRTALALGEPHAAREGRTYVTSVTPLTLASLDDLLAEGDGVGLGVAVQELSVSGSARSFINPAPARAQTFASSFTLAGVAGSYPLSFFARDLFGNREAAHISELELDDTAPASYLALSGPYAPGPSTGSFYASASSEFTLTAADAGSGVAAGEVSDNEAGFQISSAPFRLAGGVHELSYRSRDRLGNVEVARSTTAVVDAAAPVSTAAVSAPYFVAQDGALFGSTSTAVSLAAADPAVGAFPGSGVAALKVAVDEGGEGEYGGALRFSSGAHSVSFRSADRVGNVETPRLFQLSVDGEPPQTLLTLGAPAFEPPDGPAIVGPAALLALAASDPGDVASGVAATSYRFGEDAALAYAGPFTLPKPDGVKDLAWSSLDRVGNAEPPRTRSIALDATAPATVLAVGFPSHSLPGGAVLVASHTRVALQAADPLVAGVASGVGESLYRLLEQASSSAAFAGYAGPFTLSAPDGERTLEFFSRDRVRNAEPAGSAVLILDSRAPALSLEAGGSGLASVVEGEVRLAGSISDPHLRDYRLEVAPGRAASEGFALLAAGTSPATGLLAVWNASALSGWHTLRLSASDLAGNAASVAVELFVGEPGRLLVLGDHKTFTMPEAVAVDEGGNIYAADTGADRVLVFSSTGAMVASFGGRHAKSGLELSKPRGVAVGGGALVVADTGRGRVLKLSPEGETLLAVEGFKRPAGVALGPGGEILVADSGHRRLQVFSATGTPTLTVPMPPSPDAEEDEEPRPWGVALDRAGRLYATDPEAGRALVFGPDGTLARELPIPASGDKEARPHGIAVSPEGDAVFVSERQSGRVLRFDGEGRLTLSFGTHGKIKDGKPLPDGLVFNKPMGLALGADGSLYVADRNNDRVQRLSAPGAATVVVPPAGGEDDDRVAADVLDTEEGGSVARQDKTGVSVPPGALKSDTKIAVAAVSGSAGDENARGDRAQDAGLKPVSAPVEFSPHGTVFEKPVTLTLPYSEELLLAQGAARESLAISYWNEEKRAWEPLESAVDARSKTVSAKTKHFSLYQVLGSTGGAAPAAAPAVDESFVFRDLYVYPNPARGGARPVIHLAVGVADAARFRVYDVSGRPVHEASITSRPPIVDDGKGPAYAYEHAWEGRIPSGVYLFVVEAERNGFAPVRKAGRFAVVR